MTNILTPRADGRAATVATGIGSLPGIDMGEALRIVLGELTDLPHLPELPARGVGADLTGRAVALLVDLYADVQSTGWRVTERPGRDHRRAVTWARADLDELEEHAAGYAGRFKVQFAGPWTLAATVELHNGDRALADVGACRDLAESLAEGVGQYVSELRRRMPGLELVVQLDEPSLPAVLAGTVPTASGFGRLRAVEEPIATAALGDVIKAVNGHGVPVVVHCCAPNPPLALARAAGAAGIAADLSLLPVDDALAETIDAGLALLLGLVPSLEPAARPTVASLTDRVAPLRSLGFPARRLADQIAVTPACGLAGASPRWARTAMRLATETAKSLADTED